MISALCAIHVEDILKHGLKFGAIAVYCIIVAINDSTSVVVFDQYYGCFGSYHGRSHYFPLQIIPTTKLACKISNGTHKRAINWHQISVASIKSFNVIQYEMF